MAIVFSPFMRTKRQVCLLLARLEVINQPLMTLFHSPSAVGAARRLEEYDRTCCISATVSYRKSIGCVKYFDKSLLPDKPLITVQSQVPESLHKSSSRDKNFTAFNTVLHCVSYFSPPFHSRPESHLSLLAGGEGPWHEENVALSPSH